MTVSALAGVRVVDLTRGVGGAYATKLFADAGADVAFVEPEGGHPLRRVTRSGPLPEGEVGPLFAFLAAGKRSVVGALGDEAVTALIADADLIIEDLPVGEIEASGVLDLAGKVVVSISPYGRGPLQDLPGNDFTAQALSGSIASRGLADREPIYANGRISDLATGIFAAPAALAAIGHARRSGEGAHIDVSAAEAVYICTNLFTDLMFRMFGFVPPTPARTIHYPGIEKTSDGWIGLNTNSRQKLEDLVLLMGLADLLGETDVRSDPERKAQFEVRGKAWIAEHTSAEVLEMASDLRIPVAPIGNGETVREIDHFVDRQVLVDDQWGVLGPRPYYSVGDDRPGPRWPAPAPGEQPGEAPTGGGTPYGSAAAGLPLAGLKVLDLTAWWAGPSSTQLLAGLGADVVHVESIQVIDGMRPAAAQMFVSFGTWWERSAFFLSINPNKRDITLDLNSERGRELLRGLIGWADVMVENYTPRVIESWGLDESVVREINPNIVMARMPAFGLTGPWRDRVGFAQTMEQVSGLSWITGYADGGPVMPTGPCDPLGGMHAAFAILTALAERERTGVGSLVECPLVESALNLGAEEILEYSAFGRTGERLGNRSRERAPQGVYRCEGEEQWLAISIDSDARWRALVEALGNPAWARDTALATVDGRFAAHDEIDRHLAEWAASRVRDEAAAQLQAAGVPAMGVIDNRDCVLQDVFVSSGFTAEVDHPVVGVMPTTGLPFRQSGVERWIRTAAPTLGQHNHEVLADILGLSEEEIAELEATEVIGTTPLG